MRIIYLCPNSNLPTGGIRVIYRHSEMLAQNGFESAVFHPYDPEFSCTWFEHNVNLCKSALYDKSSDLIVIPEAWAEKFGQQCIDSGLHFAIFVQNGYYIHPHADSTDFTGGHLRDIYAAADFILSISDDSTAAIRLAYPQVSKEKILRLIPNVDEAFIGEIDWSKKEKIITYMPRKLSGHASLVKFYLSPYLPEDWSILPIENVSGSELVSLLARSSIFLSFSDLEGFGMPPLEAAFSGNLVVGYTGQGGKEYFLSPIFQPISNGDFKHFVEAVNLALVAVSEGISSLPSIRNQLASLRSFYFKENELNYLLQFANKVQILMSNNTGAE